MAATRCTCLHDDRLDRLVEDPLCAATLLHQLFHGSRAPAEPEA